MKKILIKAEILLEVDEKYDEDALSKANDWHQSVGKFLTLVDKTLTAGAVSYTHLTLPTILLV